MTNLAKQKFIDLHLHSIHSDGTLGIPELIKEAKKYNLKVISLTDHNTVAGVKEALKIGKREGIKVISGIEIYTQFKKFNFHLLGYNFDLNYPPLVKALAKLANQRIIAIQKSLKALKRKGFTINERRLFNTPSRYISLGQIIIELHKTPANIQKMRKGLKTPFPSLFDFINKYLIKGRTAYLPETSLPIKQAIDLIHQAGGLTVLAHPNQQLGWNALVVEKLKELGLDGLEVLSPYHGWHDIEHWQKVAKGLRLIITGGSDFHTYLPLPPQALIKKQWQYFKVPFSIYTLLKPKLNKYR